MPKPKVSLGGALGLIALLVVIAGSFWAWVFKSLKWVLIIIGILAVGACIGFAWKGMGFF